MLVNTHRDIMHKEEILFRSYQVNLSYILCGFTLSKLITRQVITFIIMINI